ncbi:MAG: methyl-accepting chemotaxis sensory transducer [Clostridia bacterium]|nr:methyl-accepting chemotaxis sensory transducer [Clostridia bacterium]
MQFKQSKGFKNTSIKTKLIIICVLFAIIPLFIVNIISSSISNSTIKNTSEQLTMDMVKQTRSSVNYFVNDIEKNMTKFVVNDLNNTNTQLLANYEAADKDQVKKMRAVQDLAQGLVYVGSIEKSIESVALIHDDGTIIGKIPLLTNEDIMEAKKLQINGEALWQKGLGKDTKRIYFIRKVKNAMIGEDFGLMICQIKLNTVIEGLEEIKLLAGANVYIVDQKGNMIYNKDTYQEKAEEYILNSILQDEESGSGIENGHLIAYAAVSNGWKVVAEIPEKSLTSQLSKASFMIWLLVIVAGILAVAVGVVVSKHFSMPIIKIMQLMKKAESGDLTVQTDEQRYDEMGLLCTSFNHMIANIRRLLEETKGVVSDTLEDGRSLKLSTEQSVEAFNQLALSIEDITKGSTNQAEDAGKSSEAMDTLSESIQQVMKETGCIFDNNQGAKVMIGEAAESMERLNQTMDSSIQISHKIKTSITELSFLTKSIEDIMKLVDGISEQTNLLALNASIEAARAGEVGKGFAVVAQEVRLLAEQSKKSTKNVRLTLNTIESKTKDAVELVKNANHIFEDQEDAVQKTYYAFNHIIERLKQMDTELGQVKGQVSNMENLREDMSSKIDRIKWVTEETASATEQVNALSEEQRTVIEQLFQLANKLTAQMDKLNFSVQAFKIK